MLTAAPMHGGLEVRASLCDSTPGVENVTASNRAAALLRIVWRPLSIAPNQRNPSHACSAALEFRNPAIQHFSNQFATCVTWQLVLTVTLAAAGVRPRSRRGRRLQRRGRR